MGSNIPHTHQHIMSFTIQKSPATMTAVFACLEKIAGVDAADGSVSQLCDCVGQGARAQTAAETAACDTPRDRTVGSAAAVLRKLDASLPRASAEDWCVLAAGRLGTADLWH